MLWAAALLQESRDEAGVVAALRTEIEMAVGVERRGGRDEGGLQTFRLLDADVILGLDLSLGEQAK